MKKNAALQEVSIEQQASLTKYKFDLLGWVGYGSGLFLSVGGHRSAGAIVAGVGLLLVTMFYSFRPTKDILRLDYKTRERINNSLLITFFIFLLVKFTGLAAFCLGLNFFLYSCLSLKRQKVYVGKQWKLQERTRYSRKTEAGRYWLWTMVFWGLGVLLLIFPLLLNRWFSN